MVCYHYRMLQKPACKYSLDWRSTDRQAGRQDVTPVAADQAWSWLKLGSVQVQKIHSAVVGGGGDQNGFCSLPMKLRKSKELF